MMKEIWNMILQYYEEEPNEKYDDQAWELFKEYQDNIWLITFLTHPSLGVRRENIDALILRLVTVFLMGISLWTVFNDFKEHGISQSHQSISLIFLSFLEAGCFAIKSVYEWKKLREMKRCGFKVSQRMCNWYIKFFCVLCYCIGGILSLTMAVRKHNLFHIGAIVLIIAVFTSSVSMAYHIYNIMLVKRKLPRVMKNVDSICLSLIVIRARETVGAYKEHKSKILKKWEIAQKMATRLRRIEGMEIGGEMMMKILLEPL